MESQLNHEKKCLMGSRDPQTGEMYFPPRPLTIDGSLRETEPCELPTDGTLYSWTILGGKAHFGQIELPGGVMIQCPLAPGEHAIDTPYVLEITGEGDTDWRFRRA